ncbi:alpha/beta fold hydrolase [Microbacterium mangrovi]|uniref:alpha/beta fold hydrolase n=1 Tax=Microbacterium mangrovi TaxID=1348253 RepID=UPI000691A129|nr:alpha/beta hydrolase [Microbacterium mangrovi]
MEPIEHRIGDIHVEESGSGMPVLLIHGNSGDLHDFAGVLPRLSSRYRVLAMDCRGYGRSARGHGPLSLARMAADAATVIRTLSPDRPVAVVGFSDGANIAMLLVARHPELVSALVLNSGNIAVNGMRFWLRSRLRLLDAILRSVIKRAPAFGREHEILRLMLDQPGIDSADLAGIRVPTLVLAGSRDIIRPAHTHMIHRLVAGSQLRIVRGAPHTMIKSHATIVGPILTAFLDEEVPARGA